MHRTSWPSRLALAAACLASANASAEYSIERVVSGLNQPIHMAQAPGDNNNLYIVERTDAGNTLGRITRYDQLTRTTSTFLDLSGTVVADGGLLSVTFHPEYESNGLFYTVMNEAGTNGLDEWRVVEGEPQLERRLYEYQNLQNVFHTMNQVHFRPSGNNSELFVTSGDGGTQANSPQFDASLIEDPNSPYGKLLKFNLTGDFSTPAGGASHPDVDVVALGLRNPFRSGFDRETGDFYIGDVGFNAVEEVDFIPASHFTNPSASVLDFGWTDREGTIETPANNAGGPGSPGDIEPIFEYAHNSGVELDHDTLLYGGSITGGLVYRGSIEELQGRYFFADFTSQEIHSGVFDPSTPTTNYNGDNLTDTLRHDIQFEDLLADGTQLQYITSFAEDNNGELYLVKFGNSFFPAGGEGEIFRLIDRAFATGDLNFDGAIDRADFVVLANNLHSDLTGLTSSEAYQRGDLNNDGLANHDDFLQFKSIYIAEHGAAAFAHLLSIPEPSSACLVALATVAAVRRRSPSRS